MLEEVNLEEPLSYVEGSMRAFISFTGDIMGSAMNNLDKLLAMSYGCGEQNMLGFSTNSFVLGYLKSSNQMSDDALQRGKKFLESGYQRQLTYKHKDGSYSAFGGSDTEGNTWLTGFVMKNFCQAREFCYIDDQHIKDGLGFLEKQQRADGCFNAKGRLLNNAMKGGVDDPVTLTSYILVALMECGRTVDDPMVKKALQCLKSESDDKATVYKLALKHYACILTNPEECSNIKKILDEKAIKGDGVRYWSDGSKEENVPYWSKPNSADVETTGYVLLAMASQEKPSSMDMGDMVTTVRWLCRKQNANGGFCSTQDTVVGLQSMSKFAAITFGKKGETILEVTSEKGFKEQVKVNEDNHLVLQKVVLPEVPGKYLVKASGNRNLFMQVSLRYNALPEMKSAPFSLSVQPQCLDGGKLTILMEFWYTGSRNETNMVLLSMKALSGYTAELEAIEQMKHEPGVKKVENKDEWTYVYIDKVTVEHQTLEMTYKRSVEVKDLKSTIVQINDYYMPEERDTVCYKLEC